jgi:hypothetical protein
LLVEAFARALKDIRRRPLRLLRPYKSPPEFFKGFPKRPVDGTSCALKDLLKIARPTSLISTDFQATALFPTLDVQFYEHETTDLQAIGT